MSYILESLKKKSHCDEAIAEVQTEKSLMEMRRVNTQYRATGSTKTTSKYKQELDETAGLLVTTEATIASLADGRNREKQIDIKADLTSRQRLLLRWARTNSISDNVIVQYELNKIDYCLAEISAMITEIEAHKLTLAD